MKSPKSPLGATKISLEQRARRNFLWTLGFFAFAVTSAWLIHQANNRVPYVEFAPVALPPSNAYDFYGRAGTWQIAPSEQKGQIVDSHLDNSRQFDDPRFGEPN